MKTRKKKRNREGNKRKIEKTGRKGRKEEIRE